MSDYYRYDYGLPESWRKPKPLTPRPRTRKQQQASTFMMCREFTPEHRRHLSEAATLREQRKREERACSQTVQDARNAARR